nr:hypothetical protein [Tanacetum cinerariifolium]
MSIEIRKKEKLQQLEQWAYLSTHPSERLHSFCYDDDDEDYTSDSLPEFENFCFDLEEISSGGTTTHSDISLPEYEAFYDDHVKEISSGSPTTHSDSSLYASFIFDLSINPFPLADRSDFYEFTDELIPFISPPEYDCFLFKVEPNSRDFTKDVVEDISPTKEPQVHNAFPTHPTLQLNLKFQPSNEYLFNYVVWIFLPFLVYSVAPHYLLSLRNEDTIFDPGICNSRFSRPNVSHRDDDSLYYENIEYVDASPHDSELVGLEVEKIVIPKDEEIEDDNLREKLLKVNLLVAEIEALKDNPTPSFEFLTKSSSTSPKPFLEGTNTFHNSLPEFENFCFDLEEISSGSTTTQSDISLPEYDSFIFDLSNDQFPPTDRSD